jgi:hypothetical protein
MHQKNYDVLIRNGKEQFVVIPKKHYEALLERLEHEEDYRTLQQAKKRNAGTPLIPHAQVVRELGLKLPARKKKPPKARSRPSRA